MKGDKKAANHLQNEVTRAKAKATREANRKLGTKPLTPIEKAHQNPTSFRYACNAMCYQCLYDEKDKGTWRMQIEKCTSPDCALYVLRPCSATKKED